MKITFKTIFATSCALFLSLSVCSEPPNLSLVKKDIKTYHDSGNYEKDLTTAIMNAHQYIVSQAEVNNLSRSKKRLAIVLDIDETSLSNYDNIAKHDFAAKPAEIHQDILAAKSPPIKPMLSLYQDALKRGIEVFFVTGRPRSELAATKINLLRAGYKDWSGLFLRPDDYKASSIVSFKAHTRELINKKGYIVIATIGDQESDLAGGFAEKGFKLPNPFYYLP
ncbi:MAG: HAD family acid phosphatase [Legionella sp.]|nr:HAD family acid phosphatase [Legionella sp.]